MDKKAPSVSFSRILPAPLHFVEKPMSRWASGKIKRLYDGYGAFCDEIGRLLGDPPVTGLAGMTDPEMPNAEMPNPIMPNPIMIEEFDFLWQPAVGPIDNGSQLLTLLSSFYKSGYVF